MPCAPHASVSLEIYLMDTNAFNDTVEDVDASGIPPAPCPSAAAIVPATDVGDQQSVPSLIEPLERALRNASTSAEMKDVRDRAAAMRQYLRNIKAGQQEQNRAAAVKVRAERLLGEALSRRDKAKGGQPYQSRSTGNTVLPVEDHYLATLKELRITKLQSSRWQTVASVPEKDFEDYIVEINEHDGELTTAGVMRLAKRLEKERQRATTSAAAGFAESEKCIAPAPQEGEQVPKRQYAPAKVAQASDRRIEGVLEGLAALSAKERALVADVMADRWGIEATPAAPDQILGLVEAERARNPAIIEEAVAYTAMAGSETAGADVDTGDDVPERDVLESGNPGLKAELSEAPALEEHDNAGQRAAQACPDISLQVVTSADLRIYPAIDPYGERDPQWVHGMLQAIGPIADAVSTLSPLPGRHRVIGLLLQLVDALAPALLATTIPQTKRGKIVQLLRSRRYKAFVDQLVRRWAEAAEAQARHNGTQLDLEQWLSVNAGSPRPPEARTEVQIPAPDKVLAGANA
jgi:hypothetical protein